MRGLQRQEQRQRGREKGWREDKRMERHEWWGKGIICPYKFQETMQRALL